MGRRHYGGQLLIRDAAVFDAGTRDTSSGPGSGSLEMDPHLRPAGVLQFQDAFGHGGTLALREFIGRHPRDPQSAADHTTTLRRR